MPHVPHALRFVLIGCLAAAVHFCVVYALVEGAALRPLVANVPGWLVAFVASFLGHHRWTFAHQGARWQDALPRFFALSAAGFAVNQSAYALALQLSRWRYDALLALVLLGVAAATYLLGRCWAFRKR